MNSILHKQYGDQLTNVSAFKFTEAIQLLIHYVKDLFGNNRWLTLSTLPFLPSFQGTSHFCKFPPPKP